MSGEAEVQNQPCHVDGCREAGIYKAPRSKDALHEYDWYCLDHVRERNRKWDFFAGMDRKEIESFMRDALTGHRPTWSRDQSPPPSYDDLHEALEHFIRMGAKPSKQSKAPPFLSPSEREALAVMDMDYPYTEESLKTCYRSLVKRYHPDANKGDRAAEEKFKRITAAYLLLSRHLKEM